MNWISTRLRITIGLACLMLSVLLLSMVLGVLPDREKAVLEGLTGGHLGGAALDVLAVEPPDRENILMQLGHPNLIITPHVAWASEDGLSRLAKGIIGNLDAFVRGEPINVVS